MMAPCPNGTRKAWRERQRGGPECVLWSSGIEQPIVVPTSALAAATCNVHDRSPLYKVSLVLWA